MSMEIASQSERRTGAQIDVPVVVGTTNEDNAIIRNAEKVRREMPLPAGFPSTTLFEQAPNAAYGYLKAAANTAGAALGIIPWMLKDGGNSSRGTVESAGRSAEKQNPGAKGESNPERPYSKETFDTLAAYVRSGENIEGKEITARLKGLTQQLRADEVLTKTQELDIRQSYHPLTTIPGNGGFSKTTHLVVVDLTKSAPAIGPEGVTLGDITTKNAAGRRLDGLGNDVVMAWPIRASSSERLPNGDSIEEYTDYDENGRVLRSSAVPADFLAADGAKAKPADGTTLKEMITSKTLDSLESKLKLIEEAKKETSGLSKEQAEKALTKECTQIAKLVVNGKNSYEAETAFLDYMKKNAPRMYEQAKKMDGNAFSNMSEMLNKALHGTAFSTPLETARGILKPTEWYDRGSVDEAHEKAAGALSLVYRNTDETNLELVKIHMGEHLKD